MEKKSRSWTKWLYWFTFAVAVIIIYKTVDSLSQIMDWLGGFLSILAPFASGILIAYILYIPCKKIEVMLKKTLLNATNRNTINSVYYIRKLNRHKIKHYPQH